MTYFDQENVHARAVVEAHGLFTHNIVFVYHDPFIWVGIEPELRRWLRSDYSYSVAGSILGIDKFKDDANWWYFDSSTAQDILLWFKLDDLTAHFTPSAPNSDLWRRIVKILYEVDRDRSTIFKNLNV